MGLSNLSRYYHKSNSHKEVIPLIALKGFSRFPIFFTEDGKKNLGFKSSNEDFNAYVKSLKNNSIAIQSLRNINFRSRFVVKGKAINPELNTEESVPYYLYVFPDNNASSILTDVFALGFILTAGRNKLFIPLLTRRILTAQEVKALLKVVTIQAFGIKRFKLFMEELDIEVTIEKELAVGTVIHIQDPLMHNNAYRVLVNSEGKVVDVDFCVSGYESMYLTELVMFARESGSIYHLSGFNY